MVMIISGQLETKAGILQEGKHCSCSRDIIPCVVIEHSSGKAKIVADFHGLFCIVCSITWV